MRASGGGLGLIMASTSPPMTTLSPGPKPVRTILQNWAALLTGRVWRRSMAPLAMFSRGLGIRQRVSNL